MLIQPAITWTVSSGAGSIGSTGLYTAPSSAHMDVITAAAGSTGITGNATVTVSQLGPTISVTNNATGTTAQASVVDSQQAGLFYTWSTQSAPTGATNPILQRKRHDTRSQHGAHLHDCGHVFHPGGD